jgi:hypothetical protein
MWCFGVHVYIFPFICLSYCVTTCVNGSSNGFLIYIGMIFGCFCEVITCYKFAYFLLCLSWCIITKVLPLSAFATVRLFCVIFFMLMSFFYWISCFILYITGTGYKITYTRNRSTLPTTPFPQDAAE